MSNPALKQLREGIKRLIRENPSNIIIFRKPMVDDGFGGEVESPSPESVEHNIKCRISHEQEGPVNLGAAPPGFSTNLTRYIMVDYLTTIYENDSFEESMIDKSFRIGPVDPLIKFGGIVSYQAPLIEAVRTEGDT